MPGLIALLRDVAARRVRVATIDTRAPSPFASSVLFAFVADRKLRIEVGRGLEGKLTDLQSGRVIRDQIVPRLRAGDVGGAVEQGTEAIRRLEVEAFPAIVLYDCHGGDLYQDGQKIYAREDA